jgi:hypothetical protein
MKMRVHKGAIIRLLRERSSCFREICASPEYETPEAFIAALEASPHEYFVDGTLQAYDPEVR